MQMKFLMATGAGRFVLLLIKDLLYSQTLTFLMSQALAIRTVWDSDFDMHLLGAE